MTLAAPIIATYSLDEVVAAINAPSVRWLQEQIRAGRVPARKFGRQWRMTNADVDAMLESLRNINTDPAKSASRASTNALGLTPRSHRRVSRRVTH
ncbi:helix-turn-helix domain-containing protein [Mycolicibacterium sp. CBM1]